MKIQLPKDDNYILMLDKISKEEKFFIHILSTCSNEALLNHLVPFVEWVWVKSDLIAWAPVLNRFDDLLQKYILHNKLNKKEENTTNQEANNVNVENGNIDTNATCLDNSFIPSDELVEEILRFTYCILDNCLNKSKYNSLDHLLALLWCFNPKISILSAEILNIYYLFIKKTKKNENKINEIISSLSALINIPIPNFLHPYINIDIGNINDNNYISGIILYYLHDFNDKKYMNNIYSKIENKQLLDLINYKEIDLNKITLNIDDNEINFTSIFPNQVSYNNSKDILQNAYDQIVNKYNINEKKKFDLRHKLRIYIGLICPKYRKQIFNLRYLIICGSLSINSILYTQIIPGNNIFIQEILYILKYHKYINNKTLSIIFDLLTTAIESHIHYKVVSDILGLRLHSGLFISVLKYYLNYFLSPYVIQKNICPLYIMNESEQELYSVNHINQLYINKTQNYINTNPQSQNNYLFQNNQSPQINIYESGAGNLSNNNLRDPIEPYNESPENGMSSSILSNLNSSDLSIISPSRSFINREGESFLENNNALQNPSQLINTHNHEAFNVTDQAQSQLNTNQVENSEMIISNNINDIFNPNNEQNASHISANNENEEVDETNFENYISEDVIIDNIKKCKTHGENEFIKVTKQYFKDYKKQKKKISMMLQLLTLYHTCIMEPCPILTIAQQNTLKSFPLYLQDSYTVNLPIVHLLLRIMETLLDFTPNFYFTEKNEDELYKVLLYRFQYEIFMISDSYYHMNKNDMLKYYFTPCCYEKYDQTFIETEEDADKYIQNKLINQYNNNPIINENNNQDLVNNSIQPFISSSNNIGIEIPPKSEDPSQSEVKNYDSIFSINNSSLRNIFEKYDINMETSEEIILNRFTFWMKLHIYNERIKITKIIIKALNLALKGYSPTDTLIDIFTNNYISVKIIKYILKYPYKFGLCIYGYILGFIYEHIYEDPTILSTLLKEGILNAMLNSINENNFKNETVLIYVPSLLSLMFIHSIGKSAMKKLGYSPIYNLFYFVIKKDYFFYDRFGDIAVSIGNIANELENYGFTMKDFVTFHIMLLKELYFEGINLGYWKCIDYNYLEKHVEQFLKKSNDIKLNDLNIDKYKHRKDNFFFDRLSIVCRCILSYMKGSWVKAFIKLNGLKILMSFTNIISLPPNYLSIFEYHPIYSFILKIYLYTSFKNMCNQFLYPLYNYTNFLQYAQYINIIFKGELCFDLGENIVVVKQSEIKKFENNNININDASPEFHFNKLQNHDLSQTSFISGPFIDRNKMILHCVTHLFNILYFLIAAYADTKGLYCNEDKLYETTELSNRKVLEIFSDILITIESVYDFYFNLYFYQTNDLSNNICLQSKDKVSIHEHIKRKLRINQNKSDYLLYNLFCSTRSLFCYSVNNNAYELNNNQIKTHLIYDMDQNDYKLTDHLKLLENDDNVYKAIYKYTFSQVLLEFNSFNHKNCKTPSEIVAHKKKEKSKFKKYFPSFYNSESKIKKNNTNSDSNILPTHNGTLNDLENNQNSENKKLSQEDIFKIYYACMNQSKQANTNENEKNGVKQKSEKYNDYYINDENVNMHTSYPYQSKYVMCESLKSLLVIIKNFFVMLNVLCHSKQAKLKSNSSYIYYNIIQQKHLLCIIRCLTKCMLNVPLVSKPIHENTCIGSNSLYNILSDHITLEKMNYLDNNCSSECTNFFTEDIYADGSESALKNDGTSFQNNTNNKQNFNIYDYSYTPYINVHTQKIDPFYPECFYMEDILFKKYNLNFFGTKVVPNKDYVNTEGGNTKINPNVNNYENCNYNNGNNFISHQNQFEYNHNIIDQTTKSNSNYKLSDYNKVHICTITSDSYNASSMPNVSFNDIDNINSMDTQNNSNQFARGTGIAISSINGCRKNTLFNDNNNCDINNNKRLGNNINNHNDYKNWSNENQMEKVKININSYTPIKTVKYISELINTLHKLLSDSKLEFVSYFYFLDLLYKVGTFDFIFNMFNYLMSVYISLLAIYFKKMKNEKNSNFYSNFTSYIPIHISKNYTCTNTYFVRYVIRLMQYFAKSDINTIKIYMEITIKSINTFLDFFMNIISIGKFNVIFFTSKMLHPFTKLNRTYGKPNNKHEKKINPQDNDENGDDNQNPHSYSNAKIKINGSRDFVTTTDGTGEKNSSTQNKNSIRFANNKQNYKNKKDDENVRKEDESNKKDDEGDKYFTYNNHFSFTLDYLDVINTIRSVKCDITNNIFMWLTYINSTSVKINNLGKNNIYINFNNNIIFGFLKIILKFIYHSIDTEPKLLEFWGKEQMKDKKFTGNKEKDKEMYNYPNIDILQELKLMGFDEKNIYDSLNCSGTTDLYSTLNYLDKTREKDNPFSLKTEKGDPSSHANKENKISFYYGSDENSSDENSTNHNRSRRNNRAEDAFRLNSFIDNMQSLSENNAAINRVENNNIEGFDKDAEKVTETDNGKKHKKQNEQDNNMLYKEDKYVLGKYPFMYEILKEAKEKGKHARLHYFETIMDPYNKKNMIFYLQYYLKLLKKKIFLSYNENNIIKKFWNDEKYLILKQYIYKYIFNMLINIMITIPYNELSFMNLYLSFLVIDIDKKSVKLFLDQYKKTIHDKNSNKSRIFNHQDVKIIILYYFIENISKKIKMLKNDESFPFEPFYHCNHLFMYFNKKKNKTEKKSDKAKKGTTNQAQNPLNNMTHSNSNENNLSTSLNNPTNNIDITNTANEDRNENNPANNRPENYQHGDYDTSNHSDDNMAESNLQNSKINNQQQINTTTNSADPNKQTNDVKSSLYGMKYIKGDINIIYESQRDMEIYSYHFCLYMLYFTLFNIINKYSLAKNIILHIDRNIIDYCIFFIQKFNISYLKSVENSVNHFLTEQNELPNMLQKKTGCNSQMLINNDTLNVNNTEICTNCDNNLSKNNKKKRKYNKMHTCGQPDENTNCSGCGKQINNTITNTISNMNEHGQENISHDPTHTSEYINNSQVISGMKNENNNNESNVLNYGEQISQTNETNNFEDNKINIMYNKGLIVNQSIKTNNMLIPYWNFLDVDNSEYNQKAAINNSSLENEENKFISLYSKPPCFYTPLFMCLYKIIINYSLYNFNDKNKKIFKKKKEDNLNEDKSFYSTNIGTDDTTLKTEKNSMIHKDNLLFTKTEKINILNDKRNSNNNLIFDMALTLSNQINANNNGINLSQKMNMENIRFISSEKQHNIIKICIDTLHFFKGYNSQLCLSILQIIEYLTTTYNNVVFLLSYRPPNVYKHFREVFEIEERKKAKLAYNTSFTNSSNTNNCFEKINKSENDIKNNTEYGLTDIHKIDQLKKEKNIESENENSGNNISELDINELILQNMCQSSLGILLTISKHAKFKDMLIILINILIQCFTDNYVIMNKIEYSLKSYFLCHGIPVKCFMKKNDLKSIKNNDFINALGVSLSELNEALYPFIFKNPQLYEEILSSLCFFPNLKYVKDPKKDKYEDMNTSTNVSYDPSILINSDFDSGKIFHEKNSNIDYINNNEVENLLDKSCKNQYYLNCLPIPENIKSIYMLSDIANSTKCLKKYYMKNNFYNFYILATLIDFLNLFTIIQSKTRVTKLNEKDQRLKFNQKLMEIYGNDVDFDNELDYKVMYPFALTADNLLFIINLIFKTFKHLIVYLIKMPPFNQKIIKTFIQPDNSPINKGDNLYTTDNTAFNNGIEKSGHMGNMNNSGSKDNKTCSINQNTTNLLFTKNKNVSTTSHINNMGNNMIAKKSIYDTKTETEITKPDSINSYKEISEYYLQNYMQLFSIFDASKLSFRSCLFPFLTDNTNIADINKQSSNGKNSINNSDQVNSYNNIAFTPFLIFLFKRILPQFICMSNPIIYSPYSFSNFEKKFTNNIDVYYASINNNESKNMAYIKHIFNFVQLIFDIHNSNYDIHKKVVLEIVHLLKIYSNFQKKKDIINNSAFTTVMSVFSNAISSLLFKLINEDQNVKIEKNSIVVEDKQILKNTKNLSKLLDSLVKIEKNVKANNDNDDDKPYQNGRRSSIGSIKKFVAKNSAGNKKGITENIDDNKEEEETEKVFAYSKEQLVLFRNSLCNLLNKLDYGKDDFVNTATSIIRSLSVLTSSSIMGHPIKSPNINSHMIKLNKINNAQKKKNNNKIKRNKRRKNISSSTFLNPSYIRFRSDSSNENSDSSDISYSEGSDASHEENFIFGDEDDEDDSNNDDDIQYEYEEEMDDDYIDEDDEIDIDNEEEDTEEDEEDDNNHAHGRNEDIFNEGNYYDQEVGISNNRINDNTAHEDDSESHSMDENNFDDDDDDDDDEIDDDEMDEDDDDEIEVIDENDDDIEDDDDDDDDEDDDDDDDDELDIEDVDIDDEEDDDEDEGEENSHEHDDDNNNRGLHVHAYLVQDSNIIDEDQIYDNSNNLLLPHEVDENEENLSNMGDNNNNIVSRLNLNSDSSHDIDDEQSAHRIREIDETEDETEDDDEEDDEEDDEDDDEEDDEEDDDIDNDDEVDDDEEEEEIDEEDVEGNNCTFSINQNDDNGISNNNNIDSIDNEIHVDNSLLNCNENQHQILDILLEEDGAYNINDDIDEYNDDYIDDCEQNNRKQSIIPSGFGESVRNLKNDERDIKTEYPSMSNNHLNSLNNVLDQAQYEDTSKANIFTNLVQTDKININNQNTDHNATKMEIGNDNNNVNQNTLFNSINNNAIINNYTNLTSESNINSNTQLKEENDGSNNKINTGAYLSVENDGNVVSNCDENKINDEEDIIDVVPKTHDNSSNNNNLNNEYDINLIDLYYHFYNYNNRDINTMLSENNSIMYLNETGRIHSTCEKNTNNLITTENQQNEVASTDNVPNPSSLSEMPVSENIIERRNMNINNNIPSRINNSPINSTNILSLMNQLCSNLLTINRRRSDPINSAIATTLHLPDGVRNNNSISNTNRFDISTNIINGNNGSNQNGLTYYHINYDRMNNMMTQTPFNNISNNRQNINNTNTNNNYMNNTNNNLRNLYNNIRNYNISDNNLASIRNLNYSNMRNFRNIPCIEDETPISDNNDMERYGSNISQANEIDENARISGDAIRTIPITEPTDAEDQLENTSPTNNIDSNQSENNVNKNKNEKNASDIDDNGKNYKDDKKEDPNNKDSKKGEKFTLIDSILDNDKKLKSDICNIMYNRLCKSVPKVNINLPFDNLVEEKNKIIDKINKCIEEKKKKKNELPIDIKKSILNDEESAKVDDAKSAIKLESDPSGNLIENATNSQTEAPLNTAINNVNEIENQTKKQLNDESQINQDNINESSIRNIFDNLDDLEHPEDLRTPFLIDSQPNNENTPNTNDFNNSNMNENDAYGEVIPEDEEEDPEDYKNINYDELFDRMLKIESIFIICCSLGINEKQFFEILNVDRAFLVELPTNLIEEIIFQHLKNITLNKIIEKEQENINNAKKISIKTYKKFLKYKEFIKSQEQSSNVLAENESNDVTATQDGTDNTLPPTGEANDEPNKEHDENVRIYNSIKKSYLDGLPSSVRSEIKKRIIGNKGQRADSQDETNIAFIESLTSDLRRDVLSSASLRFIRTLTEEMIEESRNLRFSALNNRYPNILTTTNRSGNVSQTNENSDAHAHVQSSNGNAENNDNVENNENEENNENNEHSENSDNDENDEGTIIPIENVSNVLSRDENDGVVIINGDQNEVDENDGDENDGDDNDGDTIVINDMRNMPISSRLSRRENLQGRLTSSVFINAPSNLNSHANNNFNGVNAINSIIISSNDRSPRNNRNMFFPGNRNSLSTRRRFNIPIRNSLPNINRNNFIRITYNDNNNPIIMINTGHENYDSIAVSRFLDNFLGSRSSDISIPGMGLGANNTIRGNFMAIPNSMNVNDNNDINNNANNDNNRGGNNNNEIHRITNANITNNGNNFNFNYGDSTNINQPRQLRRNDNRTNNNNTNNVDHNYHIMGDDKLLEKEDNASLSKYLKNLFPSNNNKLNADKENDTALYVCLEEPVPSQALIDICRLLFLKKEINKKIMFTLFCNLICSYQKTKLYTLQLFMNILWSASIDLHGKSDSPNYMALSNIINFPPKMLYQNVNKKTLGLFSDNYFTTSYISAERVLEQVQSLLITIPHITSFFSMELIHPALFIPKEVEQKIKKKKQKANDGKRGSIDGCRSFLDELERKRDKLELDQFEDTEDIRLNEYNENNKFDNASNKNNEQKEQENIPDDETAILEYELKRKRPKMETSKTVSTISTNNNKNDIINFDKLNNDYPINILFKLLDSSLYLTSKKLISHLLSVIYNILINSSKKEYAYANFTKWVYAENLQYIINNAEELIQNDNTDGNINGSEIIASNTNGKNENDDSNIKDNQNNEDNNEENGSTSSNKDKKEKEKNTNLNEFYHNNNTASKINKELLLNIKNIKPNEFEKNDYTLKPYYLLEVISINAISNLSKLICNYKTNFLWINSNNNLEQVHKQDISLLIQIAVIFFSHYKLKRLIIQTLKYHTHILIKRIIYDLNKIVHSINNKTFNLYSIDHSDSLEQKLIALYRVITILFNAPSVIDSLTTKKQKKNIPKPNSENENSKMDNPTDSNSPNNNQTSNNETSNIANDNVEINNATSESNRNKLENDDITNENENNKINEESKFDICADFFLSINIDLLWEEFNKTMQVINNSLIDKNYKFKCNNETQLINNNNKTKNENIEATEINNNIDPQNNNFNHPDKNTFFLNNLDSNITKHEQNNSSALFDSSSQNRSNNEATNNATQNEGVENSERNGNDQNGEEDEKKKENSDEPPPTILNYLLPLMEAYLFIEEVILVSQYKLRKFKDLEKKVANLNIESIKINEKLAYEDYPFYISIYNNKSMKQNEYHMNEFEMFKENNYEEENDQDENNEYIQIKLEDQGQISSRHKKLIQFVYINRRVINSLIKQTPILLHHNFKSLIKLTSSCINFENKRLYLRKKLKYLKSGARSEPIKLNIRREKVFTDSYYQLRNKSGNDLKGKLVVTFKNEEGVDAGGLTREWYSILAKEIFNPNYALFCREGEKCEFNHPNPLSYINPDHLHFFKFVGKFIAKAIYDGQVIDAYFCRSFYKHMLGRKILPADAESVDPEFYKSLIQISQYKLEDLNLEINFSTEIDEFGKTKIIDLIPNGRNIPVTDENKHKYIELLCELKVTNSIKEQLEAFMDGFKELIQPKLISIFDDKELELLISGIPTIDLNDLKENVEYHNYTPNSIQIIWLWEVLEEFDENKKASFLQFVTGTSRVPLGGFKNLMGMRGEQKMIIYKAYGEDRLPTAHTCFNQLDLPEYSSKECLRSKLIRAIMEGKEGFGFI
ncbi:E3 ubiquitin-protein ligase, putative [Plasmodium chabaudi adami]|uniref:HECT-type E3 ubiquitin transferase n=1 Tax=Plasmodium chabaudi adami TaxID=5826 RepID=A0A1D3RWP5_PLACE|nr:E3 ubiquitin-protein ligase, putative [Plasmodium chabaudi adami]